MDHVFVSLWSKAHKEGLLTFTNRNALSIYDKSFEYDDTLIPKPLKEKFIYEPNKKIFHQIILLLSEMDLDIEEFVFLKTLTINSLSRCEFSINGKKILNEITDELVKCLSEHYKSKNIPIDRLGELILFISNFYTTFQMFTEISITIDTFKLFDIDKEIIQTLKFSR